MNITVICHYFPPEIGAPSARIYEMARQWVQSGHEVHVVTCFPNHPTGVIPDKYKGYKYLKEEMDGIHVHRNYVYATPNKGFVKKTIGHISFMISSVLFSIRKVGKPDVIITSSPTFFSIFSGYMFSLMKKAVFILEIRDLWPAAMIELGVMKKGIVTNILERMELFFYRKCDRLIMVTKSFKEDVIRRGIDTSKVKVITNGVDTSLFRPESTSKTLKKLSNLDNKFVVSYVGAHGISQNLTTILSVAKELSTILDLHFVFVGEGAEKENLKDIAEKLKLQNVTFIDALAKEEIPDVYRSSDISLIPLKNIELFETFIPSKMFEIMACGTPIVASVKGEAADILYESGAALVVHPDDSEAIAKAIVDIKENSKLREDLIANGPDFVKKRYSREKLAADYLRIMREVL